MDELLYETNEGIATITLNRPDKLNAFTADMIQRWEDALIDARRNPSVHVVVLTGAGRAFCVGGDVAGFAATGQEVTGFDHKHFLWEQIHRIPLALEDLDKPVIAALNGVAVGAGLDMALQCDLRFAADTAKFAEAYGKVGLIPGDGGTYFLPRLVGTAKALELMWSGDFVDAQEALRIGMVNRVYPANQLMPSVYEFAQRLVKGPSLAIRMTKRAVYQSMKMDLRTTLDMISSHMGLIFQTEDHKEGSQAFVEKRQPNFKGR